MSDNIRKSKKIKLSPPEEFSYLNDVFPDEVIEKILSFVPFERGSWFSVLVTCKKFHRIGKQIFDPSILNNWAIRWACSLGNLPCVLSLLKDNRVDPTVNNYEALFRACKSKDSGIVLHLLQDDRIRLILKDEDYADNIIHALVTHGHLEVVEFLLEGDLNEDVISLMADLALLSACSTEEQDILKMLLKRPKLNTDISLVWETERTYSSEIIEIFLKENRFKISIENILQCTEGDRSDLIKLAIKYGQKVNDFNEALRIACYDGTSEMIQLLFRHCSASNLSEGGHLTGAYSLLLACYYGNKEMLQNLLDTITYTPKGWYESMLKVAFEGACKAEFLDIIKLLLRHDKVGNFLRTINKQLDYGEYKLRVLKILVEEGYVLPEEIIGAAASAGRLDVVCYLIGTEVEMNVAKILDAVKKGCRNGHSAIVQLLLEDNRLTPSPRESVDIMKAACKGSPTEVIRRLMNDARFNNQTAVQKGFLSACSHGNIKSVRFLLSSVGFSEKTLQSARETACENGAVDIVRLLLSRGKGTPGVFE